MEWRGNPRGHLDLAQKRTSQLIGHVVSQQAKEEAVVEDDDVVEKLAADAAWLSTGACSSEQVSGVKWERGVCCRIGDGSTRHHGRRLAA